MKKQLKKGQIDLSDSEDETPMNQSDKTSSLYKKHERKVHEDLEEDDSSEEEEENETDIPLKKQKVTPFFSSDKNQMRGLVKQMMMEDGNEDLEIDNDEEIERTVGDYSSSDEEENEEENDDSVKNLISKAKQTSSASSSTLSKNNKKKEEDDDDIQLSDLIQSVQPTEVNRLDKAETQLQNLEELKKMDKQIKKGSGLYYSLEETEIQKEERRAAFDVIDSQMEKYHPIVEKLQNSRTVPVLYKHVREKTEKEKILDKGLVGTGVFQDVTKEDFKEYDVMKKELKKLEKKELIERNKELIKKRIEMEKEMKKAKWLKNIKSKAYRRIIKREKERKEEKKEQEEMETLDEEEIREKILKREKELIKERLTMRHKNTSKWVKQAMKFQVHNPELQQSIGEQLRIHQDLMKRQVKEDSSEEEDEMVESMFDKNAKTNPFEDMRKSVEEKEETEKKGLLGMKFMKKAEDKRRQQNLELINEMERDLKQHLYSDNPLLEEETKEREATNNVGKMKFERSKAVTNRMEESSDEDDNETTKLEDKFEKNAGLSLQKKTVKVTSVVDNNKETKVTSTSSLNEDETTNEEPILNITEISTREFISKQKPKDKETEVVKTSVSQKRKRTNRENPWLNKTGTTKRVNKNLELDEVDKKKKKIQKDKASKILITTDESKLGITSNKKEESEEEKEEENVTQSSKKNKQMLEFEKKVKQEAFAGDDLELQFAEEKEKAISEEMDLPDFKTAALPGWGSWAGFGKEEEVKRDLEKKQREINRIERKIRKQKREERADNHLHHVIIRETAKIPDKYLIHCNNEVEARIIDSAYSHPIGAEWNTLKGFEDQVKPRARVRSGEVIKPLDYTTMDITYTRVNSSNPLNDAKEAAKLENEKERKYQKLRENLKDNYEAIKEKRRELRENQDKEKQESFKRFISRHENRDDE
ncbi:hypothetical protein ABK040_016439 [Willaertia magna]